MHDCLVHALDKLHMRRSDGDLRAWLFAIMHNLFVSRARRNKARSQTVSLDEVSQDNLAKRSTQDAHMQARDLLREPPRVCRRLHSLRRWSYDEEDIKSIFS